MERFKIVMIPAQDTATPEKVQERLDEGWPLQAVMVWATSVQAFAPHYLRADLIARKN